MLLLTLEVLTQGLREEVVAGHHTHEHRDVGRETRLSPESEPTHRRATARAPRTTRARRPTRPHTRTIIDVELGPRRARERGQITSQKMLTCSLASPFPHNTTSRTPLALAFATRTRRSRRPGRVLSPRDLYGRLHARDLESLVPNVVASLDSLPPTRKKKSYPRAHPVFPNASARRCIGGASNMLSGEGGLFPGPSGSPQHTRKHGYAGSCRAPHHR